MENPYDDRGQNAFWRPAVADLSPFEVGGLWSPKFRFDTVPIVTFGSCFAQHFGQALRANGLEWHICEPGPNSSDELLRMYNYGVFSARTGNIYTTRMLRQWLELAFGQNEIDEVWTSADGRFFDPLRPRIEPKGFASKEEMLRSRAVTLRAIRTTLEKGCVFVFTLGLTEAWENTQSGLQYAMCPGKPAGAGQFDKEKVRFVNAAYPQTHQDLKSAISLIRQASPNNRVLLTVSPVPLTATASGEHVLVATVRSKSVLRAVAADFSERLEWVDYFPSYEIITGIPFRSMWFQPNMREVTPQGVDFVMKNFFAEHEHKFGPLQRRDKKPALSNIGKRKRDDVVCEEALLEAFA